MITQKSFLIFFGLFSLISNSQTNQLKLKKTDHTVTVKTEFTPSCKTLSTTNEGIINFKKFNISPNPIEKGFFDVKIPSKYKKVEARVFSLSGQLLKKERLSISNSRVFIENIPAGIYTVRLITEEKTFNFKIIKK